MIVSKDEAEIIYLNITPEQSSFSSSDANELFKIINQHRTVADLAAFKRSKALDRLAEDYAREILRTRQFSHKDINGDLPNQRAEKNGIKVDYIGENLAIAPTIMSAHQGLMDSPTHRRNLESAVFRQIGLAVVRIGLNQSLVVEEFAN